MQLTADDDRRDVQRVRDGATDAFATLVDRHQGRIVAHLRRLVDRDAADDLAQETFIRAYTALDRFDPAFPFRGWLLVIASRLAANHVQRRRERRNSGDDEGAAPSTADPATQVAERDAHDHLVARLDGALAELPPESRALYELRFRQELSVAELAAHFQISEGAVKVRIHRLRASLADRLGITLDGEH